MKRVGTTYRLSGLLLAAALIGCASDEGGSEQGDAAVEADTGGDEEQVEVPDYDFSAIGPEMEDFLQQSATATGASIIVVHRDYGTVHKEAFGDHTLDTIALIASASKLLSAGVLMTQYDDGTLDLEEPVSSYIAECEARPGITAAHLLSNTSGMPGLIDTIANLAGSKLLCQFDQTDTLQNCAKTICSADLAGDLQPPGTAVRYGGAQWTLAGGLAEVLSGKSFEQLLTERFIEPCGLGTLRYGNHYAEAFLNGDLLNYPSFFQNDPANIPETQNPQIEGGAMCNLDDYATILLMHLRDGKCGDTQVLSREAVEQMRVDRLAEVTDATMMGVPIEAYGFGWWIEPENEIYTDPGMYGAVPWIDLKRGYGAYISLETNFVDGTALQARIRPLVEQAFDAVQ